MTQGGTATDRLQATLDALWSRLNEICSRAHQGDHNHEPHPLTPDVRAQLVRAMRAGSSPRDLLLVAWWSCYSSASTAAFNRQYDRGPATWYKPDLLPKYMRQARTEYGKDEAPWLEGLPRSAEGYPDAGREQPFVMPDPLVLWQYLLDAVDRTGRLPFPLCPPDQPREVSALVREALGSSPSHMVCAGEFAREWWLDRWADVVAQRGERLSA